MPCQNVLAQDGRRVRFGRFEADLISEELYRNGTFIPLQAVPFRLLATLVARRGDTVTREELYRTIWPESTYVVFDENLNTAIRKVRRALGDSATNPRFIETLPRRGYRFIAPVEAVTEKPSVAATVGGPAQEADGPAGTQAALRSSRRRTVAGIAVPGVVLIALIGASLWSARFAITHAPPHLKLARLTADSGLTFQPALSRDGKFVAYASDRAGQGNLDLWVQSVDSGVPVQLTSDAADELSPAFSPDGSHIVFRSEKDGGGVYIISSRGGVPGLLVAGGRNPRYSPDGRQIAYWAGRSNGGDLYVADTATGRSRRIETGLDQAMRPIWSPDGSFLLFLARGEWWVTRAGGGRPVRTGALESLVRRGWVFDRPGIWPEAWDPRANAVIFSAREGDVSRVWRLRLSTADWSPQGSPDQLTFGTGGECQASFAGDQFAFSSINESVDLWGLPLDSAAGQSRGEPVRLTRDIATKVYPDLSSNGRWLAYRSNRLRNNHIWIKDLKTGAESPLTTGPAQQGYPVISRDGSEVIYTEAEGGRGSLFRSTIVGNVSKPVCADCGMATDWSPDGRYLLFVRLPEAEAIGILGLDSGQQRSLLQRAGFRITAGQWSPDGRWIAFSASRDRERRLLIAPFRAGAASAPSEWIDVVRGPDFMGKPNWSEDGDRLYFLSERDGHRCIWTRRVSPSTKAPVGEPAAVYHFHKTNLSLANIPNPGAISLPSAAGQMVLPLGELSGNIWLASEGKW